MNHSIALLCLVPILFAQIGCEVQEPEYTVAVYPTTQKCGIDAQMMACDQVAVYLRDTLKIKLDRQVIVSSTGSDPLPKDDPSLDLIAAKMREAGFKDVRTARFDLK